MWIEAAETHITKNVIINKTSKIALKKYYNTNLLINSLFQLVRRLIMKQKTVGSSKSLWKKCVTTFLACTFIIPLGLLSNTTKVEAAESVLYSHPSSQQKPILVGNKVVWQDYRSGNFDLFLYDLETKEEVQLSASPIDETEYDFDGEKVVWSEVTEGTYRFYIYNVQTKETTKLPISALKNAKPKISQNRITWQSSTVMLFDLTTQEITEIKGPYSIQNNPDISGDYIVYEDYGGINLYQISTKTTKYITDTNATMIAPQIEGDHVVWSDNLYGNKDVFLYSISKDRKYQITSAPLDQVDPRVYGDRIVWTDHRNAVGSNNKDIYMYDLAASVETQITTNSSSQSLPTIYQDRVIWQDYRSGSGDLYMYEIPPITRLSTISHMPVQNGWYRSDVQVTLQTFGGVKSEYRINGGSWNPYSTPFTITNNGEHLIEYRSMSQIGTVEETKSYKIHIDKSRPVLDVQVTPTLLLSPNHQLVPIRIRANITDNTIGASWELTSVKSNQPDTSSSTLDRANDIQGVQLKTEDILLLLRAEVVNNQKRIYTLTFTGTDLAGNKTIVTKRVTVLP